MTFRQRVLDYATVALLVAVAVLVAFCADEGSTIRARFWSVRKAWGWAASDTVTVATFHGGTIASTSTKATALRLLRDVIGGM